MPKKDKYWYVPWIAVAIAALILGAIGRSLALNHSGDAIWRKEAGLHATPTVLVNGYKLSRPYRIEDLKYFMEILPDIK